MTFVTYGGPANSGSKFGQRKEQAKKPWRCKACGTENGYHWITCPNCNEPRR